MTNETMTIALEGDISLSDFAQTMQRFRLLVDELSKEVVADEKIEWKIEGLEAGSAIATIRGFSSDTASTESVVRAFSQVGEALQNNYRVPFSEAVRKRAQGLVKSVKGSILSIRLETSFSDARLKSGVTDQTNSKLAYAYGQVRGTVQTLSNRKGVKFTLYDSIFDKPISCYLDEDHSDIMRGAWGRRVVVSGQVGREPENYRPVVVRQISVIDIIDSSHLGGYKEARGLLASSSVGPSSEVIIRGMRDEE